MNILDSLINILNNCKERFPIAVRLNDFPKEMYYVFFLAQPSFDYKNLTGVLYLNGNPIKMELNDRDKIKVIEKKVLLEKRWEIVTAVNIENFTYTSIYKLNSTLLFGKYIGCNVKYILDIEPLYITQYCMNKSNLAFHPTVIDYITSSGLNSILNTTLAKKQHELYLNSYSGIDIHNLKSKLLDNFTKHSESKREYPKYVYTEDNIHWQVNSDIITSWTLKQREKYSRTNIEEGNVESPF